MKTINTADATGAALDWLVAKCEALEVEYINDGITKCLLRLTPFTGRYSPSTDWSQGGPIIEREQIATRFVPWDTWVAECKGYSGEGTTPLIAAMRCFVASKLGDTVELPDELV